jgi:hypothetical protein
MYINSMSTTGSLVDGVAPIINTLATPSTAITPDTPNNRRSDVA